MGEATIVEEVSIFSNFYALLKELQKLKVIEPILKCMIYNEKCH